MINVLIVDVPPSLCEFLKAKLAEEKINVVYVQDKIDSFPKMLSLFPDMTLTSIYENENMATFHEYMQKIKGDINMSKIPFFAMGPKKSLNEIAEFAKMGVHKYFMKPVKYDFLFKSIGQVLKTNFTIDTTPCIIDIHCNGNIIFIEISLGLNREKISLLSYKITELIEELGITTPRVLVLMSNLDMTFVDAINIEFLMDKILENKIVQKNNVRILTNSNFMKEMIQGHTEYSGVETATDISKYANSLAEITSPDQLQDVITDKILINTEQDTPGFFEMRFSTDANSTAKVNVLDDENPDMKQIAIVQPDSKILDIFSSAFRSKKYHADTFTNGILFLEAVAKKRYDLVVIDITMQNPNGFQILQKIHTMPYPLPVFVYSPPVSREMMVKAFSLGAKQYFVKPQSINGVVEKAAALFQEK